MDLHWETAFPQIGPFPVVIRVGSVEVARVNPRVHRDGWVSEVARHRADSERRMHLIAPSRASAERWAMAWTRANLALIEREIAERFGK